MNQEIFDKVRACLVETLRCEPQAVTPDCSLIDDLGAESIDLLDLTFRLSKAMNLKLKDDELYAGELKLVARGLVRNGKVTPEGIAAIREGMPGYDLSRFAGGVIYSGDVQRLITPRTLVNYLEKRLA